MNDLDEGERRRLVAQLTMVGWLFLGGQFGFLLFQLERVRNVDGSRFATEWDQRVEVLSFLILPPNLTVLVPPAIMACAAVWLAGRDREPWLSMLVRLTAGIAITFVFVGVAAIAEIATREGEGSELDSIFFRIGGMSMATAIALACRVAETAADRRT